MKIIEKDKLTSDEFKLIKNGLRKSRQLTPETLSNIPYYARKWLFFYEDNNILGNAAVKKSEREEYDIEIGFIYTYPDKKYTQEEIIYNLIKYINDKYSGKGIYAEVLLNPIKRIFKEIGYSKIDEWDSKVRKGNKVELYTNKNLMIISEDDMQEITLWDYLENKLVMINEAVVEIDRDGNVLWGMTPIKVPKSGNKIKTSDLISALKNKELIINTESLEVEDSISNEIPFSTKLNVTSKGISRLGVRKVETKDQLKKVENKKAL